MNHLEYFNICLKDLLVEHDLTIKQLSERSGIRLSRLYDFVNGLHLPSLANAIKIADIFRCPLDYLFGFCDDFQPMEYTQSDTVYNRIRLAMDSSTLSRYQLSKLTKISQPQLFRWYHGAQSPTLVSMVTLAEHLGCSLDYLAGRD